MNQSSRVLLVTTGMTIPALLFGADLNAAVNKEPGLEDCPTQDRTISG